MHFYKSLNIVHHFYYIQALKRTVGFTDLTKLVQQNDNPSITSSNKDISISIDDLNSSKPSTSKKDVRSYSLGCCKPFENKKTDKCVINLT